MDSMHANANADGSFLTECVSDDMSAGEAADSTCACWSEAEEALAPVLGPSGVQIVFRHGEEVAERMLGVDGPSSARVSIDAFCDWVRSLAPEQAVTACKSFFVSVEDYLLSMLDVRILRRLLRRARSAARTQFSK